MCTRWCARRSSSIGCWPKSKNRPASCSTRCSRKNLVERLETKCRELGLPCLSILGPVLHLFQAYLGAETTHKVGAQHTLNAEYFRRIDALNYTMMHDDGQQTDDLEEADVVLVGVSRTSKTPTSIYLANRGVKTANVPLVPGVPLPPQVERLKHPLVVGLFATPERIVQIRQNRLLGLKVHRDDDQYIDRKAVAEEIAASRRLCAKHNWPVIDVTRRSIEETAAAVLALSGRAPPAPGLVSDAMALWLADEPLVLASRSSDPPDAADGRRRSARNRPADLDERGFEAGAASQAPDAIAALLARDKGAAVARAQSRPPGARRRSDLGARRRALHQAGRSGARRARSCARCAAAPMNFIRRSLSCRTARCCSNMSASRG